MHVAILTTGGTIEKTYNEADGSLRNTGSVLEDILARLRLPAVTWRRVSVMSKDSLDMDDRDRRLILQSTREAVESDADAVIVVHGTDTLTTTGEVLVSGLPDLRKPVVLTGAMRPYEFRDTDAIQNVTEALLACRLARPGVYVVLHSQVLAFPGVVKDRAAMTFVRKSPAATASS